MEALIAVLVGIVSSLVATAIFVGLSELTRRVLLPWYADQLYKGVRVDGNWTSCLVGGRRIEENDYPKANLQLSQNGDVVTGTASLVSSGAARPTVYTITARIQNGYLAGQMWPSAPDVMDPATLLLRLYQAQTLRMRGIVGYVETSSAAVKASEESEFKKLGS